MIIENLLNRFVWIPVKYERAPKWIIQRINEYESIYIKRFGNRPYGITCLFKGNHYMYKVFFQELEQGNVEIVIHKKHL